MPHCFSEDPVIRDSSDEPEEPWGSWIWQQMLGSNEEGLDYPSPDHETAIYLQGESTPLARDTAHKCFTFLGLCRKPYEDPLVQASPVAIQMLQQVDREFAAVHPSNPQFAESLTRRGADPHLCPTSAASPLPSAEQPAESPPLERVAHHCDF